ncbi:MAG TPA: methylmalonyl-CoA mutase family protein [Chloroflexota bacterium]|nr:methylmalonyl-CoA mutase family protein [Chloroflexota bacterium]
MTSESAEEWRQTTLKKALERTPERDAVFETTSHIEPQIAYTGDDLAERGWNEQTRLGYPGEYPFTRGAQATMYRGRLWTMRQYAGYASAEESNARYRYLLERGQTGLSVAFDLPTQMGYDADHPMAEGEVGKVGVSISSLEDMEQLFAGIPLDKVTTSMTINATAPILLALYVAVARKQGADPAVISGTVQNDILKEYIARGTYIYPPRPSLRLITDLFAYCAREVPQWNTISISGYHMREAGATAVQELAFTLANGIAYVNAALQVGLEIDSFGPRLAFFFDSHNNLLEEVAKFRAARRMWARIMRERFGARDQRSWMMRFHTQTAGVTLQAQQIDNNVVRVTVQALAAILGGTQSLHTNAKDEALALPTAETAQLALRTQQVLAYESGVGDVVDPLAGSYYVESLTDEIERRAWEYIDRIDERGGALACVENGYIQSEIQEAAYEYQRQIEHGDRIIVGTNRFQSSEPEPSADLLTVDPTVRQRQCERLRALRARRDNERCTQMLEGLREAARDDRQNVLPLIVEAVEAYCTLGEISDSFRAVWGEARDFGRV